MHLYFILAYICISLKYNKMNIRKFKSLLAENDLTYESLAEKIGVEKHNISYAIKTKDLKVSLLIKIANALNVKPQDLL